MIDLAPVVTALFVLIGNCGFWLACFNRVNSTGMPRRWTKRSEKLLVSLCFSIPMLVFWLDAIPLWHWLTQTHDWWPQGARWFDSWGKFSLVCLAILGPVWLESRRWILPPANLMSKQGEHFHVCQHVDSPLTGTRFTAFLDRLPGNEITQLEVNRKQLMLPRPVAGVDGLKIAHISDLHFTGQLTREFYRFMVDRLLDLRPDLIAITGDIIDYRSCLPWIAPLLGRLQAPLGCIYLLGNHDKRLGDHLLELTSLLQSLGHIDVGLRDHYIKLPSGGSIAIEGNELPWLNRHQSQRAGDSAIACDSLRLGLSHSPDQIVWARTRKMDLLLAGHTHGGQVRFPGIGPIVSPSRFGSRFASGLFYREPTLMHVSRGIAGTHPLRWRCPPELSLLTLRTPHSEKSGQPLGRDVSPALSWQ